HVEIDSDDEFYKEYYADKPAEYQRHSELLESRKRRIQEEKHLHKLLGGILVPSFRTTGRIRSFASNSCFAENRLGKFRRSNRPRKRTFDFERYETVVQNRFTL